LWSTVRSVEFKDKFFDHTQENRVVILFSKNHEDVTKMIKKLRENGLKFSLTEQRKIITDAFVLDYFILSEEKKSHACC
jgi:predicted transcriptional regulator